MQRRRFHVWPALLIFGVLLTFTAIAPVAVGATALSVSFGVAANGATALLTLNGNGFGPGERITISGITNGGTVAFPDAIGNAIGAFSTTYPANSAVYRLVATGQMTGITAIADTGPAIGTPPGFVPPIPHVNPCDTFDSPFYYAGCPGANYSPGLYTGYPVAPGGLYTAAPPTSSATAPAAGTPVMVGTPLTVAATGFTPNETVAASVIGPDGTTTQIGTAPAAADGSVTITITFPSAGSWQVTAHGQTSQKDVINRYTAA